MRHRSPFQGLALVLTVTAMLGHPGSGFAADSASLADPFITSALVAEAAGSSVEHPLRATPCQWNQQAASLDLSEVVDRALCRNPQTREAWANARYQAAQVGMAESAYLPAVNFSLSGSRNSSTAMGGGDLNYSQTATTLSFSYLLYDFGGRAAALENAWQVMAASNASQDATLQAVFLAAVQAYYQWHAAQAAVMAARESERASQESLKGAVARYQAGTATPADKLQAQTAASQATLTRIRAEGDAKNAQGNLANIMGLAADQPIVIAAPSDIQPDAQFEGKVKDLIETAKRWRPDLAAAEAQVMAARSAIDAARATGMPSISLFANRNDTHNSLTDPTHGNVIGIAVNIPIFSGFNTTYRVRAAEAQLDVKAAQRDRLALQVTLDVWRAYQALITETQAIRAATDLLASATQSAQVAEGRYRAGVGGILDLLNAQSALASARQQHIQELYNWRLARVTLGQAMGQLDFAALETKAAK